MTQFALTIDGMHCGACVRRVRAALEKTPGVRVVEVDVGRARGEIDGDDLAPVVAAVANAGYTATAG
jgi:copper chaperone CopZ